MKALLVANLELDEHEGIYKKVEAEATAIGSILGRCDLITRNNGKAKVKTADGGTCVQEQTVLDYTIWCVDAGSIDFLYIRHMIPTPKLIQLLRQAKKKGIQVYYEIPTYPYFGEQLKASRRKYRALIKIGLDIVFWPVIYLYIDRLVVIRSSTKSKKYSKMIEITNGVRVDNIKSKSYSSRESDVFRMVAVGTLYPYHGYDRILKGMAACGEYVGNTKIEFHVVGSSATIDELQHSAEEQGLRNVIFHGMKSTKELNEMYEQFDVGLGCLALHRRNADIDTTLKVIEYYCRGIPVISSGICPLAEERFSFVVSDNEDAIDIADIYHYYCGLEETELRSIAGIAKQQFAWESIMTKCLKNIQKR